jgi:hypothetical protein
MAFGRGERVKVGPFELQLTECWTEARRCCARVMTDASVIAERARARRRRATASSERAHPRDRKLAASGRDRLGLRALLRRTGGRVPITSFSLTESARSLRKVPSHVKFEPTLGACKIMLWQRKAAARGSIAAWRRHTSGDGRADGQRGDRGGREGESSAGKPCRPRLVAVGAL